MNNPDVTHRWVTDFDTQTCRAIVALVDCATSDGGTLGYAGAMSASQAQAFIDGLRRRVADGDCAVLLGHVEGLPAFLAMLTLARMPNCRHRAELSKGVVHPRFRGRNFVQLALREFVRRAEELEVQQFVLDVREGSRAHRLWDRFGFETFGVLEDYARFDGKSHRGHFMVQSVASLRSRLWSGSPEPLTTQGDVHA